MDCQNIIETFFYMLGRFDFDRAKAFIDGRKEVMIKLAPSFPYQGQLMNMLTAFGHLAEIEKQYHNQPFLATQTSAPHSFLPSTNFLRKTKSLKEMYSDIEIELQQFENADNKFSLKGASSQQHPHSALNAAARIRDYQPDSDVTSMLFSDQSPLNTSFTTITSASNSDSASSVIERKVLTPPRTLAVRDGADTGTSSSGTSSSLSGNHKLKTSFDSFNSVTPNDSKFSSPNNAPPNSGFGIRSSFLRVLSPNHSHNNSNIRSNNILTGYDAPPNSSTTTPLVHQVMGTEKLTEQLINHFCNQLYYFTKARLAMVDMYETLSEALSKRYATVDSILCKLMMVCRQYQKYFHHPLLSPIKDSMTMECESLVALMNATIGLQHWRFLDTLFALQEAQSKLNYWAANSFQKEPARRRFKVSKTNANAPRLYEWLCKYREFLIAKFTLYFHSSLAKNCSASSFRQACSKLSIDYYSKLVSFSKKFDNCLVFTALLFDIKNQKGFRGIGYTYQNAKASLSQAPFAVGKNTLQPMLVIPNESRVKLNSLQAEIYMIVTTNEELIMRDGYYQFHDNIKKLTYCVTKPDLSVVLVIVVEGQRNDRDSYIRSFSADITNQFAFVNLFNQ